MREEVLDTVNFPVYQYFYGNSGSYIIAGFCEKNKTGSVTVQHFYSYEVRQIFAASAEDLPASVKIISS